MHYAVCMHYAKAKEVFEKKNTSFERLKRKRLGLEDFKTGITY